MAYVLRSTMRAVVTVEAGRIRKLREMYDFFLAFQKEVGGDTARPARA
jgi:hypothetical protein